MDSPSVPTNSLRRDAATTRTRKSSRVHRSSVEEEYSPSAKAHSVAGKTRIPKSAPDDLGKSQEADVADGRDQKPGLAIEDDDTDTTAAADSLAKSSSSYRRVGGSKRKKGNSTKRMQQEEKSKEKLKVLAGTLKLIPFKPVKTLDFFRHESLLKTLGLWDFVHLEFDQYIHYDLVAQLIASYSSETKCSYVNGARINVTRADLARALKLPNKKERVFILDEDNELLESDESIRFVDEIVSDWILLHCDDAWMMPDQVVEWRKGIKEKKLNKLDWAGLFWIMVEKELKAEPSLGDCFYASHMQMVIRSQKKDLLRKQSEEDNDVKVEDSVKISPEEDAQQEQLTVEDVEVKEVNLLNKSPEEDAQKEHPRVEDVEVKEVNLLNKSPEEDTLKEKSKVEDVEVKEVNLLNKSTEEGAPKEQSRVEDVEIEEMDLKVNDDIDAVNLRMEDGASDSKEEKRVDEHKIELNLGQEAKEEHHHEEQQTDLEGHKEQPVGLEKNKEQPMDLEENKEEPMDLEGNKEQHVDDGASDSKEEKCVEEHKTELNLGQEAKDEHHYEEQQADLEGNKEQPMDLEENNEQPMDLEEDKEKPMDLEENKEQPMDLEENKEEGDEKWLWNEHRHAVSHYPQGCDVGGANVGDEGNGIGHREVGEDETLEDGEKHEGGFPLFPKSETLHEVGQDNLLLDDTSSLGGYNSGLQIHGSDFLGSRAGMNMVPGSSHYGNDNKREMDHENDISYHFDSPATKRMKNDGPSWDDKPVPFEVCMEQIKQLVDKAKLSNAEKDRGCAEYNMSQQFLMNEVQKREEIFQQLHKETYEEQRRKDTEIFKLENELRMMASVLAGYRKALKDTQKVSRKHMKCCPLRGESLYKDVKGSGGLVVSATEVEMVRLKQEEEEKMRRGLIERQVDEFEILWIKEFELKLNQKVELIEEKLIEFENKVKLLKETVSRRRVLDTPERVDALTDT